MGDDGVGPVAIEALQRRRLPEKVRLYDAGLAASDVIGSLHPNDPLIVIDALRGGGEPGSVYETDIEGLAAPAGSPSTGLSLHEISVLPTLQMESMTGRTFRDVTVFGVEPDAVEWGAPISAPVARAIDKLVEAIAAHADAKLACMTPGDSTS